MADGRFVGFSANELNGSSGCSTWAVAASLLPSISRCILASFSESN
jgi:hypothetical protein